MPMLIINQEQMETFQNAPQLAFEDEMTAHLAGFSPPLFKALGEEPMRVAIRFGIAQAGMHGFTCRGPIRQYLEMMLLFGSHFDTDPQYPWATALLKDDASAPEMKRAEHLYEAIVAYRKQVGGPQDAFTIEALRRITRRAKEPAQIPSQDFIPFMLREMAQIYPQKSACLAREHLEALARAGVAKAHAYGFTDTRGHALMCVLMLAFGHGCDRDPLYPWIARTLTNEATVNADSRARRLEAKATVWLDHVLAYFDGEALA